MNKTKTVKYIGVSRWPEGIFGWIRVTTMIVCIAGLLGIFKNQAALGQKLLKHLNLPSLEICYAVTACAAAAYLICVIHTSLPKARLLHKTRNKAVVAKSKLWRSL